MPGPLPAWLPHLPSVTPTFHPIPVTLCPRQQYQSHHYRETGYRAYHGSRQVAPQLSWLRICFDSHIKDGAVQIASPLLPSTHPSGVGPRSYRWLSAVAMERGMEGCWGGLRSLPHTSRCSVLPPISLCSPCCSQTRCSKKADAGLLSGEEKSPFSLSLVPGGS